MRKQLCEIATIDRYLLHEMTAADRLVFHARMIINPELKEKVRLQRKSQQVITWLAREQKRNELEHLYNRLMADKSFASQLKNIFK